jgi:hypothetical protein
MSGAHPPITGIPPLSDLVTANSAARPGRPLKPHEIARGITATLDGRHVGAATVLNFCLQAAATGRLVQVADAPIAFAFPDTGPPADEDGIKQS